MDFTFGILTSKDSDIFLDKIIESIVSQKIPNFEVILIGDSSKSFLNEKVKHIAFDETLREGWITRKKNLITQNATYENIVFMHDYLILDEKWYEGYLDFGNNFQVCINQILTKDKERYRDWTLWPLNNNKYDKYLNKSRKCLLPYEIDSLSKYMYISGAYWVSKKKFMTDYPLNEDLLWNEGEDVEWSKRIRKKIEFKFNHNSSVSLLKEKKTVFKPIDEETLESIIEYDSNFFIKIFDKIHIYIKKVIYKSNQSESNSL